MMTRKGPLPNKSPDLTRPTVFENHNYEIQHICDNVHVCNERCPGISKILFRRFLLMAENKEEESSSLMNGPMPQIVCNM